MQRVLAQRAAALANATQESLSRGFCRAHQQQAAVRHGRRSTKVTSFSASTGTRARAQGAWGCSGRFSNLVRQSSSGGGGGAGNNGSSGGGGDGSGKGDGGDEGGKKGGLLGLWAAYLAVLDSRPVATKAVTASALNALGDVISQQFFEEQSSGLDWKRTAIFALLGFILVGPALHFWYGALARLVPQPGTKGALFRLAGDQLAFAPPFIALFFSSLLVLEGHPKDIPAKLKQDWKGAVVANWKLWIPFQFINFRFVPQQLQVLMANTVAVGWNTYLSWASHRKVGV